MDTDSYQDKRTLESDNCLNIRFWRITNPDNTKAGMTYPSQQA